MTVILRKNVSSDRPQLLCCARREESHLEHLVCGPSVCCMWTQVGPTNKTHARRSRSPVVRHPDVAQDWHAAPAIPSEHQLRPHKGQDRPARTSSPGSRPGLNGSREKEGSSHRSCRLLMPFVTVWTSTDLNRSVHSTSTYYVRVGPQTMESRCLGGCCGKGGITLRVCLAQEGQRWAVTRSGELGYYCHISSVAPAGAPEGTSRRPSVQMTENHASRAVEDAVCVTHPRPSKAGPPHQCLTLGLPPSPSSFLAQKRSEFKWPNPENVKCKLLLFGDNHGILNAYFCAKVILIWTFQHDIKFTFVKYLSS